MYRYLLLLNLWVASVSCKQDTPNPAVAGCYGSTNLSRAQHVVNAPVTVVASGGLYSGYMLISDTNGVAWGNCGLPEEFKKNNLKIYVTGYFLTSPELDLQNISPLPFEVTTAKSR